MHSDEEKGQPSRLQLSKSPNLASAQGLGSFQSHPVWPETPFQIGLRNGLPALLGAAAGLAVAGAPLYLALAVGFVSGLAFTFLRIRSQN